MRPAEGLCNKYRQIAIAHSKSTGYEYKEYLPQSKEYIEIIELLNKILPDKDTREFTLKSLASCLDGYIRDENFYIWAGKSGIGSNGKSTSLDIFLKSLGDYGCTAPVSLITGKRESSNNANSALFSTINKRAIVMQEPEANEVINSGIMKALTGGDPISTRELNSSQVTFKPSGKLIMATNRLPTLSSTDGGTERRIKITEFTSKFVDNPNHEPQNGIHEYLIDRNLKTKLDSFKPVFMCILIDYYKLYKKQGLNPPIDVIRVTKKYENDNNMIKTFIDEYIQKGDKTHYITKDELKDIFKNDYTLKANFLKFNTFVSRIENALFTEFKLDSKKKIYKLQNYYLKSTEPELDDEDEHSL